MPLVYAGTVRVDLPAEGEWVELKEALSRGDEERRRARLVSAQTVNRDGTAGPIDAGVLYEVSVMLTMELAIAKWSFMRPVNAETIGHLDDASFDMIAAKCEELYGLRKTLTDDGRKNSSGVGATPSEPVEESPTSSAGSS